MANDYLIVPSYEPAASSIAAAVPAVLGLFGDTRDHPVGLDLATRADVLAEVGRYVVDAEIQRGAIVRADDYRKLSIAAEATASTFREQNATLRQELAAYMDEIAGLRLRLAQADEAARDRDRLVERLRQAEHELAAKLAEIQKEAGERRDGYFKHVEALERTNADLTARLGERDARLRAIEDASPSDSDLATARFDLAERLAVWLDTNPASKGGAFER